MKLYQSTALNKLNEFVRVTKETMRPNIDVFLMWKTIEYFNPATILEIGLYAGQTLSILSEASGSTTTIDGVDININNLIFDSGKTTLNETDSMELTLLKVYDFVHIDGNHKYEFVSHDVQNVLNHVHTNSIICLDDYNELGPKQAINEQLLGQNDWVPFLKGYQNMWFHHVSHSADEFLDNWLQEKSKNFIWYENEDYFKKLVLSAKMPHVFEDSVKLFLNTLEFYNL